MLEVTACPEAFHKLSRHLFKTVSWEPFVLDGVPVAVTATAYAQYIYDQPREGYFSREVKVWGAIPDEE